MEIIKQPQTIITGRFSDGSDRQEKTIWNVTVKQNGYTYFKSFDNEPSDEDIHIEEFQDITPKETLLQQQVDFLTLQILELMGV